MKYNTTMLGAGLAAVVTYGACAPRSVQEGTTGGLQETDTEIKDTFLEGLDTAIVIREATLGVDYVEELRELDHRYYSEFELHPGDGTHDLLQVTLDVNETPEFGFANAILRNASDSADLVIVDLGLSYGTSGLDGTRTYSAYNSHPKFSLFGIPFDDIALEIEVSPSSSNNNSLVTRVDLEIDRTAHPTLADKIDEFELLANVPLGRRGISVKDLFYASPEEPFTAVYYSPGSSTPHEDLEFTTLSTGLDERVAFFVEGDKSYPIVLGKYQLIGKFPFPLN